MANQWLLKTEPSTFSFQQLQKEKRTVWDGVRNPQALKYLAQVRKGDRLFVYHTGAEKAVVGVATAVSAAYPDPHANDPKRLVLDIAADQPLPRPVTLASIKADPACTTWELVRLPRLSVMPVSSAQWAVVERLARG